MFAPVFAAIVQKNKLIFDEPDNLAIWLGQFLDKKVEVVIKKKRKKRTSGQPDELGNQNAWYWGVILPLCGGELGYTSEEIHEIFISQFAPYIYKDFAGQKVAIKIRTHEMDTIQFTQYVESIRVKMSGLGITIPDPEKIE